MTRRRLRWRGRKFGCTIGAIVLAVWSGVDWIGLRWRILHNRVFLADVRLLTRPSGRGSAKRLSPRGYGVPPLCDPAGQAKMTDGPSWRVGRKRMVPLVTRVVSHFSTSVVRPSLSMCPCISKGGDGAVRGKLIVAAWAAARLGPRSLGWMYIGLLVVGVELVRDIRAS